MIARRVQPRCSSQTRSAVVDLPAHPEGTVESSTDQLIS